MAICKIQYEEEFFSPDRAVMTGVAVNAKLKEVWNYILTYDEPLCQCVTDYATNCIECPKYKKFVKGENNETQKDE